MKKVLFIGLMAAALSTPALAQDLDITITHLTHGSHFTPILVAVRDDVTGVVTHHGGIVSRDDCYTASALTEAHRFDNPMMRIELTRL